MPRHLRAFVTVAALACADASAIDLVGNGSFAGNIDGWGAAASGGGVVQYESYLGSPNSGSLRLTADAGQSSKATQCVDVHVWVSVDFALRKIKNSEYGDGSHDFHVDIYDADGCDSGGGGRIDTIAAPESGASVDGVGGIPWVEAAVSGVPLPVGARSALIVLQTSAGASSKSEYLMDLVRFGPLDVIFVDPFDPPPP